MDKINEESARLSKVSISSAALAGINRSLNISFEEGRKIAIGLKTIAAVFLAIGYFASALFGSLELVTGDLAVELSADRCWTVYSIYKSSQPICDYIGSGQGSVLNVDGEWAGSIHLNEELLQAQLFVDGIEQPVADGLSYAGTAIKFVRKTKIGGAYELTSIMTITEDYTNEYIIFQGIDASKICEDFYGFLGSRENRFIEYSAHDVNGVLLSSGMSDEEDGSTIALDSAAAVSQYDPLRGDGVCSIVKIGGDLGLYSFIWDRAIDNKLYVRFTDAICAADPNNYFSANQRLLFFEADSADWLDTAGELVALNVSCPAGDAGSIYGPEIKDCRVDFYDFAAFGRYWLDVCDESDRCGGSDLNQDGWVDHQDLMVLSSCWLHANLEWEEVYW